jgi:DNA-binding HxlR family transcriptional regulator
VLDAVGDMLGAIIVEYINHLFIENDKKPVWLKLDTIHKALPYITRSGLAKRLKKLVLDGHIIKKDGEGRHYHKCWYSPSPDMREACKGTTDLGDLHQAKVYYNKELAEQHVDASVVYAAIINLLKVNAGELVLDYEKLVEGSGLTLSKVRKAVRWLIENKKIDAKRGFGSKYRVKLPPNQVEQPGDLGAYLRGEPATESFHPTSDEEDLTEY